MSDPLDVEALSNAATEGVWGIVGLSRASTLHVIRSIFGPTIRDLERQRDDERETAQHNRDMYAVADACRAALVAERDSLRASLAQAEAERDKHKERAELFEYWHKNCVESLSKAESALVEKELAIDGVLELGVYVKAELEARVRVLEETLRSVKQTIEIVLAGRSVIASMALSGAVDTIDAALSPPVPSTSEAPAKAHEKLLFAVDEVLRCFDLGPKPNLSGTASQPVESHLQPSGCLRFLEKSRARYGAFPSISAPPSPSVEPAKEELCEEEYAWTRTPTNKIGIPCARPKGHDGPHHYARDPKPTPSPEEHVVWKHHPELPIHDARPQPPPAENKITGPDHAATDCPCITDDPTVRSGCACPCHGERGMPHLCPPCGKIAWSSGGKCWCSCHPSPASMHASTSEGRG